ncbi:hypothetical protein AB5J72_05470 [Streptomyces sp. CG1]|uniref:hypothetical protein n=1 Tax=Streptomyces sp. CG1 TaxID=1287523 RepID=UPI0034E2A4F0
MVQALIGEGFAELGGARLRSLVGLRRPAELTEAGARLAAGLRSKRSDVPGVLAAATLALVADPDRYDRQNVGEGALLEVLALVPRGPRAATATAPQRAARDSTAGHDLFDLLRAAHRPAAGRRTPAGGTRAGAGFTPGAPGCVRDSADDR